MIESSERLFLALESSSSSTSVAIGTYSGLVAEITVNRRAGHSTALLPATDRVLRSAGLEPRDLGGVVVGSGPGSFTGLRIAGATAKGIAHSLDLPLYAYSSLLVVATQAWASSKVVRVIGDARHRDVYSAAYRFGVGIDVLDPPSATTLDAVIGQYSRADAPIFIGDGAVRHREELTAELGDVVAPAHFATPRAASLVWLACRWPSAGLVESPAMWEPEYLRPSGAERIAAARSAGSNR